MLAGRGEEYWIHFGYLERGKLFFQGISVKFMAVIVEISQLYVRGNYLWVNRLRN